MSFVSILKTRTVYSEVSRMYYFYETIKNLTAIFGTLFDEVQYKNDKGELKKVPIFYAPREKFLVIQLDNGDIDRLKTHQVLPRMGYEMVGLNYAPERTTNQHSKLMNTNKWQYNRVPYDFAFNLYIATRRIETSTQIVEQILPLFAPSFNITVNEMNALRLDNDIAIVLNSVQHEFDYAGSLAEDQRAVVWTLAFTVKAWLYKDTKQQKRITETITRLTTRDLDRQYRDMTALVSPKVESPLEPHIVIEHGDDRPDIFGT